MERWLDRRRAEEAYVDQQLVTRAAWEAAHLQPLYPDWSAAQLRALVLSVALVALRATLSGDAYQALHRRFCADRDRFINRLVARGV